jgi:hypothetical protein
MRQHPKWLENHGRYLFNIKASGGPGQGLRPFRDPDAAEDDEAED